MPPENQTQNPNPLENNHQVDPPITPPSSFIPPPPAAVPPQPTASTTPNTFVPPPQYTSPAAPVSGGGLSLTVIAVVVAAVAVVGGGYYWMSSSRGASPEGENSQLAPATQTQSNNSQPVPGKNYCGNWPSVSTDGFSQYFSPSETPPANIPSNFYLPPGSRYIGKTSLFGDSNPVLTGADTQSKGMGYYFFCTNLGLKETFDSFANAKGDWRYDGIFFPQSPDKQVMNGAFRQEGAQDYTSVVNLVRVGDETLIMVGLSTYF